METTIGMTGQLFDNVFKIAHPRSDVRVTHNSLRSTYS